jgi:hypothetical protein
LAHGAVFGVQKVTAESLTKLLGMGALGEAEKEHVLVITAQRVRPRAEQQSFAFAEEAHCKVAVA